MLTLSLHKVEAKAMLKKTYMTPLFRSYSSDGTLAVSALLLRWWIIPSPLPLLASFQYN
jgi:hypothetical protein